MTKDDVKKLGGSLASITDIMAFWTFYGESIWAEYQSERSLLRRSAKKIIGRSRHTHTGDDATVPYHFFGTIDRNAG